jgi:hypothetical protein
MDFVSRLFPQLPAQLDGFTTEELTEKLAANRATVRTIAANDEATAELCPTDKFNAQEILDELTFAAEQTKLIEAELALRKDAETTFAEKVAALSAEAGVTLSAEDGDDAAEGDADADAAATDGGDDDAAEGDAATDEAATDGDDAPEPDEIVAAAVVRRPSLARPPVSREAVAVESDDSVPVLLASAGIEGIGAGSPLDRVGFADAAIKARTRISARPDQRTEVVVASAHWNAPPERMLDSNDHAGNMAKIEAVAGPEALVAAGGLCAPLTPIYALPQISSEARPLRDALPPFQADRGGITWAVPPSIFDVDDAVGIVTAEQDGQGGTFAAKSCQFLDCQDFLSAEVDSIYHCLEWGNLGSRAWPERVAQFTDVVMAAWARLAETNILNQFKAGSTQVTAAQGTYGYGALSDLTSQVLAAAAGYRSRFRMENESRFRFVASAWVRDLILSDLINAQFDRFAIQGHAGVDAFLRQHLIDPVWTIDGETNGGQVYGAQTAGALLGFPDEVKWFLFPEGTWIFLDSGVLELGIVRDSVLNAENLFQVFGESFETVAQVGYQSLEITSALCPSGATGGPATLLTC